MNKKNYEIVDSTEKLEKAIERVREAQKLFAAFTQEQVDKIFLAAATAAAVRCRVPVINKCDRREARRRFRASCFGRIYLMIRTTVKVSGMICGMCEAHVNDAVRAAFAVKKVSSSRSKGETVIESEHRIDTERLKQVVNATGYIALSVSEEEIPQRPLRKGILSSILHRG